MRCDTKLQTNNKLQLREITIITSYLRGTNQSLRTVSLIQSFRAQ